MGEDSVDLLVAHYITLDFRNSEVFVGLNHQLSTLSILAMPARRIAIFGDFCPNHYKIRLTYQLLVLLAIANAYRPNSFAPLFSITVPELRTRDMLQLM